MMKKMMFRGALLCASLLLAFGCTGGLGGGGRYETYFTVRYEPDYSYEVDEFLDTFFNGGKDSICVNKYLTVGPLYHCSNVEEDGTFVAGCAMCTGVDTLVGPGRKLSRFAVFDKGGNEESMAYAVFHDTLATLMPEHDIVFTVPNESSSCTPSKIFVQNVQAVVQASRYGSGLIDGPFGLNDYLTLTITGSMKEKVLGSKTVKLVDGTHVLEGWTEVDLSSFGDADALDFHLESNRPDLPLYCCLDDLIYHYLEVY